MDAGRRGDGHQDAELDGIAATAQIMSAPLTTTPRVLILTTFEEDDYVVAALRAGASGFIGKGAEPRTSSVPCEWCIAERRSCHRRRRGR